MRSRTATCSCGQLRIEVRGEPLGVGVCHCLACQRRTGSVFAALAAFAAPYTVTGAASEHVRVGDQGARFTFRFCPICGTTVCAVHIPVLPHLRDHRVPHRGGSGAIVRERRRRRLRRPELSRAAGFGLFLPQALLGPAPAGNPVLREGPKLNPEARVIRPGQAVRAGLNSTPGRPLLTACPHCRQAS